MRLDVQVCVQASSNQDEILTEMYPGINLVRKRFEGEIFEGVKNGECRIAVTPVNTFEVYVLFFGALLLRRRSSVSKGCKTGRQPKRVEITRCSLIFWSANHFGRKHGMDRQYSVSSE